MEQPLQFRQRSNDTSRGATPHRGTRAVSHFRSNLRDIDFNLFEVLGADAYYGTGPFSAIDVAQARMIIEEFERFCRESSWAASFVPADR